MRACRWAVAAGFSLMMAAILAAVLTMETAVRPLLLGQGLLLAIGLAVLLGLCALTLRPDKPLTRRAKLGEAAFWLALFVLQAVLCFFAYFMTGWDVKTLLESAYALAGGDAIVDHYYYSLYPNNAFLTLVFSGVMRAFRRVSPGAGLARCAYILIVGQCTLNTLAGVLTRRTALQLTGSRRLSWLAAAVYAGFVGLSPWLMIPYSDSMALLFPVAVLYLYAGRREKGVGTWLVIGLLTGVGYLIKPQAAIVTIALGIVEAMRAVSERRPARFVLRAVCVLGITALLAGPGFDALLARSGIHVRAERTLGPLHFAMMGLSERTGGTYDAEDLARSVSVEDPQARAQMQREEIAARLEAMGLRGLARHLLRKTRINYGDGLFAWGGEGNFFAERIGDKDGLLSPALKRAIGCEGDSASGRALASWMQAIWLALLAGSVGMGPAYAATRGDENRRDLMLTLMLALIGLTLFETIFEARARYLYAYAPFYVLAGICGIRAVVIRMCGVCKKA